MPIHWPHRGKTLLSTESASSSTMKDQQPEPIFDENQDLDEIWPQLIIRYEQITKQKLNYQATFATFPKQVEQDLDRSPLKRQPNARRIFKDIGDCLNQIGQLVAQAGSIVFGPAAQCWNAINFVISAAAKYSDVLEGFVTLMERSLSFLRRLSYFLQEEKDKAGSRLPQHLRQDAYKILAQFFSILEASYKVATSKREKFKIMFDVVVFNADGGVEEALDLMEASIREFTRAQVDVILKDVQGLARYLRRSDVVIHQHHEEIMNGLARDRDVLKEVIDVTRQIKSTTDVRITKEQHREDLTRIWTSLGFKRADEQDPWWDRIHNDISTVRVSGTGKWLEQEQIGFTRWADSNQHETCIFLLKAASGSGKTFLSNYVISYLQEKYRAAATPNPAYVAYYYFSDSKEESSERFIGSIVHQFARFHNGYAKAVAETCEKKPNIVRAEDRWNTFIPGMHHTMKGTYYICVDGVESCSQSSDLKTLLAAISRYVTSRSDITGVSLRFFVSGTEQALAEMPIEANRCKCVVLGNNTHPSQPTTGSSKESLNQLASPLNASDLELVARARIDELSKAKPDLKPILTEPKIKLLVAGIRDSYQRLEAKLTEIRSCDTEEKVESAIRDIEADMDTVQRNSIRSLNASLDHQQVRKLNNLLLWVAGTSYPRVPFLQSALYFTFRKTFLLQSDISTTYSALLRTDQNQVVAFTSEDLVKILRGYEDVSNESLVGDRNTRDITQGEIDLCRRFVRKAFDKMDYKRFRFDEFFDTMTQKEYVHLDDKDTINLKILTICVDVLCGREQDEKLKGLVNYASVWFYEHLNTLSDRLEEFEPSRHTMAYLGEKVVELFSDPQIIDVWFSVTRFGTLYYDWFRKDDFVNTLFRFLKNPYVAKGYRNDPRKREWVEKILADNEHKYLALELIAAHLAGRWFSCTYATNRGYLGLSFDIIAKASGRELGDDRSVSLVEVDQFIQWAKDHVEAEIPDHIWNFRIGATYKVFDHYKKAISFLKNAEPDLSTNWGLMVNMAVSYDKLKNFRAALEYYKKFNALKSQYFDTDEGYVFWYWINVMAEGNCHRECQDYSTATQCYKEVLQHDFDGELDDEEIPAKAVSGLFLTWIEAKSYHLIIELMADWKNAKKDQHDVAYWFKKIALMDTVHQHILTATKETGAIREVCAIYQCAIDHMSTEGLPGIDEPGKSEKQGSFKTMRIKLRYFQAAIFFHGSLHPQDHDRAITSWESIVSESHDSEASFWAAYDAFRQLSSALLDRAVIETQKKPPSTGDTYIDRLQRLCKSNVDMIRYSRDSQRDPRYCLARYHHLQGETSLARTVAQSKLRSVFDYWPEDDSHASLELRYKNLAQTLTVLDLDNDAIAAWQAPLPRPSCKASTTDSTTASSESETAPDISEGEGVDMADHNTAKAYIQGNWCDGPCGTKWEDVVADCWVCKHCLDVQLCTPCYKKLQASEIHPLSCNRGHQHLYLPPFDQTKWLDLSADMMIVDNQPVLRLEWLEKIRDEFEVQQEQIDSYKIAAAKKIKAASLILPRLLRWRETWANRKSVDEAEVKS